MDRRLPRSMRTAIRQWSGRQDRDSSRVTVVVATSAADATWFGECLDSLRSQTHRNLEILVSFYGTPGAGFESAKVHARSDWRVRLLPGTAADEGTARNRGAKLARGRYLCFVDVKDLVAPTGLAALVESLDRSGSDLAVGREIRLPMQRSVEATPDPAHDAYLQAITMAQFPFAVADTGIGNRLFRRSFWHERQLHFPQDADVSRPLTIDAYVLAEHFDVLPDVTYHRVARGAGVAFGTIADAMAGLERWLVEQRTTWRTIEGTQAVPVRDAWAYVLCDTWATPFIDDVERATLEQWAALRDYLAEVVAEMDASTWARVRAESKVKVWLLVNDRRAQLENFLAERWFELGNRPTEIVDGEVRAVLPFLGDPEVGVPDSCFAMSAEETRLNVVLRGVRWGDQGAVELDLFAYIGFVGTFDETPAVEAYAVSAASGSRVALRVEQWTDPEVSVSAGHRYQDYARGACTVHLDTTALVDEKESRPAEAGRDFLRDDSLAEWSVELRMTVRGIGRSGTVTRRDERGTAGLLSSPALGARIVAGHRVQLSPDPHAGLRVVALAPLPTRLEKVTVKGRRMTGRLATDRDDLVGVVATRPDGATVRGRLRAGEAGGLRFTLDLSGTPVGEGIAARVWRLRVLGEDRVEHEVGFGSEDHDVLFRGGGTESDLVVARNGNGACDLVECDRTAVLESLELTDGQWRATGHWPGRVPRQWGARLRNKRFGLPATELTLEGQRFAASGSLSQDEWGLGSAPLPSGLYFLDLLGTSGTPVRLVLSSGLNSTLLSAEEQPDHRAVRVCHGREVAVRLTPPLAADERGPFAQKQLQRWLATATAEVDPKAVYLQSYTGAVATDSQRAIHEELSRTRPDLTLYWGVADRSTRVPEGARAVLMHSREWYRVLATSKYLCNNIDFDRWFVKRPDQQLLQTFHGYPSKSMGIRLWEAKRFTPRRIELELDRTSRGWDLILTPTPEMDIHYRTEYRYDGAIESAGYPRDDALLSPEADEIRRATRERLGVTPQQVVVLYAPTWRDDLATSYRSAPLVRHLDLESATKRLGEEFVFLMRGHRFHARGARRSDRSARLIDVTDYPEINDLILAADAAVLDYSSLRFDFALTGRPMLFLVPDLASYVGGVRGFLYPFEESAPGPLIGDAEDVVDRLRDLDTVRAEFKDDYAQFNERFNYLQDGRAAERVARRFFA